MIKRRYKKRTYRRRRVKTSKLESKFAEILTELGIKYRKQFKLKEKYYDFYIPKAKILIEVDGDYWHANPNTKIYVPIKIRLKSKKNDSYKNYLAASFGYKLLRFWENDIHNDLISVKKRLMTEIRIKEK